MQLLLGLGLVHRLAIEADRGRDADEERREQQREHSDHQHVPHAAEEGGQHGEMDRERGGVRAHQARHAVRAHAQQRASQFGLRALGIAGQRDEVLERPDRERDRVREVEREDVRAVERLARGAAQDAEEERERDGEERLAPRQLEQGAPRRSRALGALVRCRLSL